MPQNEEGRISIPDSDKENTAGIDPPKNDIGNNPGRPGKTRKWLLEGLGAGITLWLLAQLVPWSNINPWSKPPETKTQETGVSIRGNVRPANPGRGTGNLYAPPQERYDTLVKELGVTPAALKNFFEIMKHRHVPPDKLDHILREMAEQYKKLQPDPAAEKSGDPKAAALRVQADQAVQQGAFALAEELLNQAGRIDENAAGRISHAPKRMTDRANLRFLSAAASKAGAGDLKMIRLDYRAAADDYAQAAKLVPAGSDLIKAAYLNRQGQALLHAGKSPEAEAPLKEAMDIRDRLLKPNDPRIGESLSNLAALDRAQGKYAQAEPLLKRALKIMEQALGPDHPDTAATLTNLARLYEYQGKFTQAELVYQRDLKLTEQALGPDHPRLAVTLNNLAELDRAQGKYDQAEPLYQRALKITEKALGPDHPRLAATLNNLAGLYQTQKKYDQAEPLYQRSLKITEKVLGPDHPDTAMTMNNLAALYYARKKYDQAEPLYQRALEIKEKALGPEHPDTATSLNNLAALYQAQGKYAQAEPLYKRALEIKEKALGPEHPDTAGVRNNLAKIQELSAKAQK
ncbi:MAG: tetratricopeptide repeat protein [Deltaproteobacteria bacterium]|nr:tetratricopeptide repeat protein [Deltaproteobacteria bacterium]